MSTQVTSSQGTLAYPKRVISKGEIASEASSRGELPVEKAKEPETGIRGLLERMMTFDAENRDQITETRIQSRPSTDAKKPVDSGKGLKEKTKQFTLGAFGPVAEENSSAVGETSGPSLSLRQPQIVHHHTNQIRINIGELPPKRSFGLTFGELADRK